MSSEQSGYPPIGDYALISNCEAMALISRDASIDWCCLPRVDSGSCFGRLLDWQRGGFCQIRPIDEGFTSHRSYLEDSMILATTFSGPGGEARVQDLLVIDPDHLGTSPRLLRVIDGLRGVVRLRLDISPRFDYGAVRPLLRYHGRKLHTAIGGNDALLIASDLELERQGAHDLVKEFTVTAQQRIRISIRYSAPSQLRAEDLPGPVAAEQLDADLERTLEWWRAWASHIHVGGPHAPGMRRSALVLKALTIARSGAIVAAATTSLPESIGADRNWDYRFSWIRDASFSVRSLADIGCFSEADAFRRYIEESAAGAAEDLQIMYGVGGERRLTEVELNLAGYRGSRPVRVGNAAHAQLQLDVFGELMQLIWDWHERGHSPDDDSWRFITDLVETAIKRWKEADRGIWEVRGAPEQFVHSKVMIWVAVDRALRLAEECMRAAPVRRWKQARDQIRKAVEKDGYDSTRNTFVQSFGSKSLDAALLLLPATGFIDYSDPRMLGTVTAIREDLEVEGLVLRYRSGSGDGLQGREGAFLACTLWLAECLARQGRLDEARDTYDRVLATGNDLGLFSEEFDPGTGEMLGNFPQALTHLSHILAGAALNALVDPATPAR